MCPWLPTKLYESLPMLYAAAALLCLVTLGLSGWTALSAGALVVAATLTVLWRREYRRPVPPVLRSGKR